MKAIDDADKFGALIMSDITFWEIAELSDNFDNTINKDPADRIISATSVIHNAQLVTADQNLISSYSVNTLW